VAFEDFKVSSRGSGGGGGDGKRSGGGGGGGGGGGKPKGGRAVAWGEKEYGRSKRYIGSCPALVVLSLLLLPPPYYACRWALDSLFITPPRD